MRRREFIILLGAGVLSQSAFGQENTPKIARIGLLGNGSASEHRLRDAFIAGLRELDLVEGKDFVIEGRFADGRLERLPALATDLVREKVDIIVTAGQAAIRAVRQATSIIPTVVAITGDPVAAGFVDSLARPGGTVTGLSMNNTEISAKRLELLREVTPAIARVAALNDPALSVGNGLPEITSAALSLDIKLQVLEVAPDDFERAFASAQREQAQAVIVLPTPFFNLQSRRTRLAELALQYGLPSMYEEASYVRDGGLMSYGPDFADMYRRAAGYVAKILKGTRPGDLPIEQPTKFELVINLKTAKALGLIVPSSLLTRADEVIE